MLMALVVWFLIRCPSLPCLGPTSEPHVQVSQPPPGMVNHQAMMHFSPWPYRPTGTACTIVPAISSPHSASAVLPRELYFPWDCLMKNNEQISHIPQAGTHHDKTHTRLMLWFKGIIQLCLTRNHLEQDHCFGCAQGSHGTNEHAKM